MDPYFYFFMWVMSGFFSFKMQTKQDQTAIIGCNLSKKHKVTLHKTQNGQPKFFFDILLGATCTKTWGQISKYYRAGQLVGRRIV